MTTPTVTEIRAKYPKPSNADLIGAYCYCVGGALTLYLGIAQRFPMTTDLVLALKMANPELHDTMTAFDIARDIMGANDSGDFEAAWAALDRALRYPEAEVTP